MLYSVIARIWCPQKSPLLILSIIFLSITSGIAIWQLHFARTTTLLLLTLDILLLFLSIFRFYYSAHSVVAFRYRSHCTWELLLCNRELITVVLQKTTVVTSSWVILHWSDECKRHYTATILFDALTRESFRSLKRTLLVQSN